MAALYCVHGASVLLSYLLPFWTGLFGDALALRYVLRWCGVSGAGRYGCSLR